MYLSSEGFLQFIFVLLDVTFVFLSKLFHGFSEFTLKLFLSARVQLHQPALVTTAHLSHLLNTGTHREITTQIYQVTQITAAVILTLFKNGFEQYFNACKVSKSVNGVIKDIVLEKSIKSNHV